MDGSMPAGGIPVIMLESIGVMMPAASPQNGPQINPQSNTGICIGRNTLPAPNAWNTEGRIIPIAMNNAVNANVLVGFMFLSLSICMQFPFSLSAS